jgi:KUP system potassium uptake protein
MTETEQSEAPAVAAPALAPESAGAKHVWILMLGALGVVFGDIGTSPLYALRECFTGEFAASLSRADILGVLSLIFWSLTLVVSIKYLLVVFRADNHGEGGILALLALNMRWLEGKGHRGIRSTALLLGLFGAGLLYGDGVITPAISVLSAIEGLKDFAPNLGELVVPLTAAILIGLFLLQQRGTAGVGAIFGPLIGVWFVTIAAIGLPWIVARPEVLLALNPLYAASFFFRNGLHGFLVLGAVVLAVTGVEALYADMGHFGKGPIRLTWYGMVAPCLVINYFGQGALLLEKGKAVLQSPFYGLAPGWFLVPLIIISTMATVIASQALISGAFSLTQQAIQLGYLPRMNIIHTSSIKQGQIYIPTVNWILMILSVGLVLQYKDSSKLASMYGMAVIGTMITTSLHFFITSWTNLKWGLKRSLIVLAIFLAVDLAFISGNLVKLEHGAWLPIILALGVFLVMQTWNEGIHTLLSKIRSSSLPLEKFADEARTHPVQRVRGAAIFLTANAGITPSALAHHFKHNQVLHQTIVVLSVINESVPKIEEDRAFDIRDLGAGFYQVLVHNGYMQHPDIPDIIRQISLRGVPIDSARCSYYVGRETVIPSSRPGMALWRKRLFLFLFTNARPITPSFKLPPNRVIEIGAEIEL